MRKLVILSALGAVLATSGCDSIFCTERTLTYELVPGATLYELNVTGKNEAERQGYTCTGTPIKDANGTEIGTHYVCKKTC